MKIPRVFVAVVASLALTLAGPARAAIDFEQGSIDPFDTFTVPGTGVTFSVDPAFFASAGDSLWSDLDYDFVLGGALELQPAGILTIEFDVVAASLEFGVARQAASDLFEIASVDVLDADGLPVQTLIELPLFASDTAPERRFSAFGVKRVIVTLDPFADEAVGIDNIVYAPVPEPSAWAMLVGGLLLLASALRRVR